MCFFKYLMQLIGKTGIIGITNRNIDMLIDLKRRADNGDSDAQWEMARVERSEKEKWLCLAAHSGHAKAQFGRGVRYKYGYGGIQLRTDLAYLWFALAAQNGDARATKNMDAQRATMSPEQIAEAERLATEWQPNPEECEGFAEAE